MSLDDSIAGEVVKGVVKLSADVVKEPIKQAKQVISGTSQSQVRSEQIKNLEKQEAGTKGSIPSVQAIIEQEKQAEMIRRQMSQEAQKRFEGGMKEVKKPSPVSPASIPKGTSKKPGLFTGKSNVKTSDQLYNQG